mgnify:CR=1
MENRRINRKYSPEFKISCIIDMRDHNLSYSETARKYLCEKGQESIFKGRLKLWERIFLEEGEAGFYIERRGRKRKMDNPNKGRPKKKLDKQVKQDLIAENQQLKERVEQLEMENEYLKKLDALVRKRLQNQKKK